MCHLQWMSNCINLYPYLLYVVIVFTKMPWCLFLGGFNTISWKSQADVQSSFSTHYSVAWVCLTGYLYEHFSTPKLADAGNISVVNTDVCLLWILMGQSLTIISVGASSVNFVSQTFLEDVNTCVRTLTCSCLCLLRTVCGCWLSLAL